MPRVVHLLSSFRPGRPAAGVMAPNTQAIGHRLECNPSSPVNSIHVIPARAVLWSRESLASYGRKTGVAPARAGGVRPRDWHISEGMSGADWRGILLGECSADELACRLQF